MTRATNRRAVLGAVLTGGAATVIAMSAAASKAVAASEPYEDAALFALLIDARAVEVLQNEVNDAEEAAWDRMIRPDRPSALNPRPDDHFLVRTHRTDYDENRIRELRRLVEGIENLGRDSKIIDKAEVKAIKARSREIVDAWDSYQADFDRATQAVGLPAIDRRWREAKERRIHVWSEIAQTPARTVEGIHAKIAFAARANILERADLVNGTVDDLLLSAAMDYADLHGEETRA
jgi:hypothetical protein